MRVLGVAEKEEANVSMERERVSKNEAWVQRDRAREINSEERDREGEPVGAKAGKG